MNAKRLLDLLARMDCAALDDGAVEENFAVFKEKARKEGIKADLGILKVLFPVRGSGISAVPRPSKPE